MASHSKRQRHSSLSGLVLPLPKVCDHCAWIVGLCSWRAQVPALLLACVCLLCIVLCKRLPGGLIVR